MVVLAGALAGVNVFLVLMTGTVLSMIAGVATGAFGVGEMFTHVGAGITVMYDSTVISLISVSYTHLYVYKRQGPYHAVCRYIYRGQVQRHDTSGEHGNGT